MDVKHSQLAHYTGFDGLIGILEKQCLWFSDADGMNDEQELQFGFDLVEELVTSRLRNIVNPQIPEGYLTHIADFFRISLTYAKLNIEKNDTLLDIRATKGVFIASFCEIENEVKIENKDSVIQESYNRQNGLLSMFRGYGSEGGGFVIKFHKEKFEKLCLEILGEDLWFVGSKVEYLERNQSIDAIVNHFQKIKGQIKDGGSLDSHEAILRLIEYLKQGILRKAKDSKLELGDLFLSGEFLREFTEKHYKEFYSILSGVILSKHFGFHEEKEYRSCVILSHEDKNYEIKSRAGKDGRIRAYIEVFKDRKENTLIKCIDEILVGPSKNKRHNKRRIEEILLAKYPKIQGSKNKIKVRISETPYI